jgi:hypothetical protein
VAGRSRPSAARSTVVRYTLPPSWASTGLRYADQRPARAVAAAAAAAPRGWAAVDRQA